jgi:hypothetical protein
MAPQRTTDGRIVIPTAGEVFPDGAAIELLRDPGRPEKLSLVHCNQEVFEVRTEMPRPNGVYVPISTHPIAAAAIRFPTRVAPPESTKQLFADVHALLRRYSGQLDLCITAMVFAIFASWLSPVLQMAPILSIFAPTGSPKNVALQLLSLLCRRPLWLAGANRSDLLRVPMSLQPTLLLDEPDLQPGMQSILLAAAHRGAYVPSRGGVRELFGSRIILSSKSPLATSLEADGLHVALIPVSGQLPTLDKKAEEQIAADFQSRFLGYFLRNFNSAQIPNFDVSNLALPLQAIARALGAAVIGDAELQARILPLLKIQDEEIRADRARKCDAVVLEALLFFIHVGGWSKVRTDNIAEKVGAIYKGRGSDQQPSPETVGWAIRRLGIPSGRINRAGNGVELDVGVCRLIHRLALSHGVRAMGGGPRDDCRYCRELEPEFTQAAT